MNRAQRHVGQRAPTGAETIAYFETEEHSIFFSLSHALDNMIATVTTSDGTYLKTLRQDDAESGRRFYMRVIRDALHAAAPEEG